MSKILVTGGAGNIGGALLNKLISFPEHHVVAVDNLLTGNLKNLPDKSSANFTFIELDVNEFNSLQELMVTQQFDYVFHYAAVVGVQRTLSNPIKVLDDIKGIKNLLDLAKATQVKRVFYSSSSEVYGEPVEFPQNEETTPLNSRLPYAVVKNVGEAFLKSYFKEYGLPFTIFRFFNTYGPRQSEDFVITKFINQAVQGKPLTIFGSGEQTRTFCYIDDNIDTTVACLRNDLYLNEVINVGNDEEYSIKDLALKIIQITQSNSTIEFLPALKEGDMTRRKPDISKMKVALGRSLTTLEEGLTKTLAARK